MEINGQEFKRISEYILKICGIKIPDEKKYLIIQRLEPILKKYKCENFTEFYKLIQSRKYFSLDNEIIIAITTNETSFFRDKHLFEVFYDKIMPQISNIIKKRKNRSFKRKGSKYSILSAGTSTGQEPYSLAMKIYTYIEQKRPLQVDFFDFNIKAIDIASDVLARALMGLYNSIEVKRGLDQWHLKKFFNQMDGHWKINEEIKSIIEFQQKNLIQPLTALGGFDLILCRNVLIYFESSLKKKIIDQFYNLLSDDGILILGSTENLFSISDQFVSEYYDNITIYKKKHSAVDK